MSTYVIGDLQGCYQELLDLLDKINFDEGRDRLWFTGDLVNRGPRSLECLRFVKENNCITVLGNHDLHLLAVAARQSKKKHKDTLETILSASDRDELLDWLLRRPLLFMDDSMDYLMVHAGLAPQWDVGLAAACAQEVEVLLRGRDHTEFLSNMYGDKPDIWSDTLRGWDRYRFITNCLTRIRYCTAEGRISMTDKGPPGTRSSVNIPWYAVRNRSCNHTKIVFGHWATIRLGPSQDFSSANVFPLDGGCVWGGCLMALRLEDETWFEVPSRQKKVK